MTLAAYILWALTTWTSSRHIPAEQLQPWADAMAAVCQHTDECITLAALSFEETGYTPWAVDQSCNDEQWRNRQRGWIRAACDGGAAFGPWQLHDSRAQNASPDIQASVALEFLRSRGIKQWTTWSRAQKLTAWWLQTHPLPVD
jgi:hypothetical protein